jgi:hypothetical protein
VDYERRAELHNEFWERKNKEHLVGFSPGEYFISKRFAAARPLLDAKRKIGPGDVDPQTFLSDYENMYETALRDGGDLFYTPEPMPGLPWLEAMSGFPVHSGDASFFAKEAESIEAGEILCPLWFDKYTAFADLLSESGSGRYLCGQPILRGPADLLGTGIGQQQLIFEMTDHPADVKLKLEGFAELLLRVLGKSTPDTMYGGHAMGFYHLWCPGDCLWFQDDLTALLSPELYKEFLFDIHEKIACAAAYSMMHLHMASSFISEFLLEMDGLNAIQVNKDIGDTAASMLPLLKQIREVKNLVLWGDFSRADVSLLKSELDPAGVYIIVFGADWKA